MLNGVSIKPLGLLAFGAIGCLSKKLGDGLDLWLLLHSLIFSLSSLSLSSITEQFFQAVFSKFFMVSSGCNTILQSPLRIVSSGGSDSVPHH